MPALYQFDDHVASALGSGMRTRKLIPILCALAAGACKQSSPDQQKPAAEPGAAQQAAAAPAGDSIAVGATLPLTGSESRIGGFYKEGYDLAFEEWNKNGGVKVGDKKLPVKLTLLDDTSTQAT